MSEQQPLAEHGREHGKASSWAVVAVAVVSFAVGGAALILDARLAFYACAAVFVLCVPAGHFVGIMGDTVQWTTPQPSKRQRERGR